MKRPLISIVTPSFNQGEFLEQTIGSVLGQAGRGTDFDLEYFVIDGGSNDHSADIIRQHQADLAGWCSEADRGQTHAINKGFCRAGGDILAYINSDDFYLPGAFQHVTEVWHHAQGPRLFHGVCRKVDVDGNRIADQISAIACFRDLVDIWEVWLKRFDNQNFIQPEVFWTRDLARRVGDFNESMYFAMDFEFWLRALDDAACGITRIDAPLAAFRVHEAQKTTQRDNSILEMMDVLQPYLDRDDDPRISADRDRIIAHNAMERYLIDGARRATSNQRLRGMMSLASCHPGLLRSPHFWRNARRTCKRWVRRSSAA